MRRSYIEWLVMVRYASRDRIYGSGGVMMPVTLTLPYPPSVNAMYANRRPYSPTKRKPDGAGRYPTKRYVLWKREADTIVMISRVRPVVSPVAISVALHPPTRKARRDCDNLLKPLLDCLVRTNVLSADDSRIVRSVRAEWGEPRTPAAAVITIAAAA